MANNYTEFSEALVLGDSGDPTITAKRDWISLFLSPVEEEDFESEDKLNEWLRDHQVDEVDDWFGFGWEFESEQEKEIVWIHSGDGGNLNSVSTFVQSYLKKFDPDGAWVLQWADICSKPRVGEFGGGTILVTANGQEWDSTSSVADDKVSSWEEHRTREKARDGKGVDDPDSEVTLTVKMTIQEWVELVNAAASRSASVKREDHKGVDKEAWVKDLNGAFDKLSHVLEDSKVVY